MGPPLPHQSVNASVVAAAVGGLGMMGGRSPRVRWGVRLGVRDWAVRERGPSKDYWFPPTTFWWTRFSAPSEKGGQMNPLVLLEVGSTSSTPMVFELRYRRSSFDPSDILSPFPPKSTDPLNFSVLHGYLRLVFKRERQSFSLSPPPRSC